MPPTTLLIVDLETRRDTDLMTRIGYEPKEGAFLPLIYHVPCSIACGYVTGEGILSGVESLGDMLSGDDPCALTNAFWEEVNHAPVVIGFNSRGFDMPVMELCALRFGCCAPKHWSDGQSNTRYRYSKTHLDMLDILSNYGGATKGLTLAHVVQLLGYAGKDGMDGSMVQEMYESGELETVRQYNRLDIVRTYAVWLHWARIAGRLTEDLYQAAMVASKPWLDQIRGR